MENKIAIIGKTNVGKSTLFNKIIGKRKAIIHDDSNVTRDRIYNDFNWNGKNMILIDTGGIHKEIKSFQKQIAIQAKIAIEESNVLLFVVNGRKQITYEDHFVANLLRKTNKKVIVIANKLEGNKIFDDTLYELGFEDIFPISALHGEGIGDVLDLCLKHLNFQNEKSLNYEKIALIGKPNAGKSSLLNVLLNQERAIVSDIPGTTRDSISSLIKINDKIINMIDTAGIKKKSKLTISIEHYALLRAMNSIYESNLTILIIDATKKISHFDLRIAGYALEKNKPIIIVVNKWDLIKKTTMTMEEYKNKIYQKFAFMNWSPILFISALKNQRIEKLKDKIISVLNNIQRKIKTSIFNEFLNEIQILRPPKSFKNHKVNIKFGSQLIVSKIPTFILFVNKVESLHFSYKRYIENQLRLRFDFEGTPIKFIFNNSKKEV